MSSISWRREIAHCHLLITKADVGSPTFSNTMIGNANVIIHVDVIEERFMIVICTHIVGYNNMMIPQLDMRALKMQMSSKVSFLKQVLELDRYPYMMDALIKLKSIWDALPEPTNIKGDKGIIGDLRDASYSDVEIIQTLTFSLSTKGSRV